MPSETKIHRRLLEVLSGHPKGINIGDIRTELGLKAEEQQHLDRRVRDLDLRYRIERVRSGREFLYVLKGRRKVAKQRPTIPRRLRGEVLMRAAGTCAMCGRTIALHGITLQVDHALPVDWGGPTELGNLQALCEEDNAAKKAYFASFDLGVMKAVCSKPRVHQRIGDLLVLLHPKEVPSFLLAAVARQEDWHKRLRELRVLGWKISVKKRRGASGRVGSSYLVEQWTKLPEDPSKEIRRLEHLRGRNK